MTLKLPTWRTFFAHDERPRAANRRADSTVCSSKIGPSSARSRRGPISWSRPPRRRRTRGRSSFPIPHKVRLRSPHRRPSTSRSPSRNENATTAVRPNDTGTVADSSVRRELVVFDSAVEDLDRLIEDIRNNSDASRHIEYVVLGENDGIERINSILASYDQLDAVHFVSHARDGALKLGDTWITDANFADYSEQFAALAHLAGRRRRSALLRLRTRRGRRGRASDAGVRTYHRGRRRRQHRQHGALRSSAPTGILSTRPVRSKRPGRSAPRSRVSG